MRPGLDPFGLGLVEDALRRHAEICPEATHAISGQCATEVDARILDFLARFEPA
ncbi:hypothetical protein ACFU76_06460 [Streptomyces sp. NPDC057539]|uniref:hypothetical protein n=1 Tax=Streptomyces sp. NPDC057539 TaxID=3346159 RepID=UPI00368CE5DA